MMRIERTRRRIIGIILMLSMCFATLQTSVFAASSTDQQGNDREVYWDDEYIYFHYEGEWSNWMNTNMYASSSDNNLGNLNMLRISQNNMVDSSAIEIRDGWNNVIAGAEGTVNNSNPLLGWDNNPYAYGNMEWTVRVPWSTYEAKNVSDLNVTWDGSTFSPSATSPDNPPQEVLAVFGEVSVDPTEPDETEPVGTEPSATEPDSTEPIESETPINPSDLLATGIVIDGHYEDWESLPTTEITYTGNNGTDVHEGQIYNDGENLYVHFKMADSYNGRMQVARWNLKINDKPFVLQIQAEKNGSVNWGHIPHGNGIHTGLKCFIGDNPQLVESTVALTIYTPGNNNNSQQGSAGRAQGDEIEFAINLEDLSRLIGIPVEDMRTIGLGNDNIGTAEVITAGTSSGPIIGVAVCVVAAAGSYLYLRKKKFKKEE